MIAMLLRQFETRIANILKVAACRHTVVMKGFRFTISQFTVVKIYFLVCIVWLTWVRLFYLTAV